MVAVAREVFSFVSISWYCFTFLALAQEESNPLVDKWLSNGIDQWYNLSGSLPPKEVYDYIVVGAGPGGIVTAARLAEANKFSVLLLEAGGYDNYFTDIPYMAYEWNRSPLVYRYVLKESRDYGSVYKNSRSFCHAGKATGGSTMHNGMVSVRGDRNTYDRWCRSEGLQGWCYEDVLEYYKKLESYDSKKADPRLRGTKGPLPITDLPFKTPLVEAFIEAANKLGIPEGDLNGYNQRVVGMMQMSSKYGRRWSASAAYLDHANKNLDLQVFAKAERILLEKSADKIRAFGVEFRNRDGHLKVVKAKREIIIAGGPVETPKLLMMSGIGPAQHLQQVGIKPILNLPVGENLIDHATALFAFTLNEDANFTKLTNRDANLRNYERFRRGQASPLSSAGGEQATIFYKSKYAATDESDIQIDLVSANAPSGGTRGGWVNGWNGKPEIWDNIFAQYPQPNQMTLRVYLNTPVCRGFIKLNANDPQGDVIAAPSYFCHKQDILATLEGARLVFALSDHPSFKKFGIQYAHYVLPGCEHLKGDEFTVCYFKTLARCNHHFMGTCRMGRPGSRNAVVDSRLKVIGTENLRIADTSVPPTPITGNTQLFAYMVGERAADFILQESQF